MSTIERLELKEINDLNTAAISRCAGVYVVHCPLTGYTKFGRASCIRSRLKSYSSMCLNGGGVVIFYKVMSPNMIVVAEKTLLSIATTRLKLIDKNEYFKCTDEAIAYKILDDSLLYLTKYYVSIREILAPVLSCVNKPDATVYESAELLHGILDDIVSFINLTKHEEHMEIYNITRAEPETCC